MDGERDAATPKAVDNCALFGSIREQSGCHPVSLLTRSLGDASDPSTREFSRDLAD
jgi:hypothetical protein